MWIITEDLLPDPDAEPGTYGNAVGVRSVNYKEGQESELTEEFRIKDDDDVIYYYGKATPDTDFDPLDDFGMPNAGCTSIEYKDKATQKWAAL